jgi:hypothetical protein
MLSQEQKYHKLEIFKNLHPSPFKNLKKQKRAHCKNKLK